MLRLLLFVSYAALQTAAITQAQNGDARFQEHFHPDSYGAYPQNWSVEFGAGGVVYVANRDGVLQFDGQDWTIVRVPNKSTVRSLAAGPDNKMYVGAQGEFGYLAPDADGGLEYISLVSRLPADLRDFTDVWNIHVASYGVFFQTRKYVFLLSPTGFRHWVSRSGYHTMHGLGDSVFLRENGVGLRQSTGADLVLLRGGGGTFRHTDWDYSASFADRVVDCNAGLRFVSLQEWISLAIR